MAKPSLCFVNRCYWPDSEATGQLLTELAESLTSQFDVHVICGQPNSPATDDFVRQGVELRNNVTIHRLKHRQFKKRIPAGRIVNLVSFTLATSRYLRRCSSNFDVLVSETDPFLLPPVVAKDAARRGAKFVAYLQDIYPDVAIAIGKAKSGKLTDQIRRKLRGAYNSADRIIVLGRCMRDRLIAPPWTLDQNKIDVIPNWADTNSVAPVNRDSNGFRQRHETGDQFVVMHSGNMGLTQRLDLLIDSASSDSWPAGAILMLVGDGASRESLQKQWLQQNRNESHQRVQFLPYQPRHQLGESLSAADVHVVSMDAAITGCLCPSKLYGILAVGRPVIAIADAATELATVVRENKIGLCIEPGNKQAFLEAVTHLASDPQLRQQMGRRARDIAVEQYDRKVVIQKIKKVFCEVAGVIPCDESNSGSIEIGSGSIEIGDSASVPSTATEPVKAR